MTANMAQRILLCLFVLISAAAADYSNFTTTCENPVLHASRTGHLSQLSASCVTNAGEDTGTNSTDTISIHNSTLDLNLCLGIDYTTAALVWSIYGKFSNYCTSCWVVGRTGLGCTCSTLSGVRANSTIDLDSGISNVNGTLSCQGGIGMDS
ncbi:hypothetical protein Sste5344_008738 [Sporothrix stenoceras]